MVAISVTKTGPVPSSSPTNPYRWSAEDFMSARSLAKRSVVLRSVAPVETETPIQPAATPPPIPPTATPDSVPSDWPATSDRVYVRGYLRKNGTYVSGYNFLVGFMEGSGPVAPPAWGAGATRPFPGLPPAPPPLASLPSALPSGSLGTRAASNRSTATVGRMISSRLLHASGRTKIPGQNHANPLRFPWFGAIGGRGADSSDD